MPNTRKQPLTKSEIKSLIVFAVLFAAGIYLVIRFISAIAGVVLLFSLVSLFTVVLSPLVTWLERHRVPRYVGAAAIALLMLGAVVLTIWGAYPVLQSQFAELFETLPDYVGGIQTWLGEHAGFLGFEPGKPGGRDLLSTLSERAGPLLARVGSYTLSALGLLASAGIVFISTIYALAWPRPILEGLLRILGPGRADRATEIMRELAAQMRRWAYSVLAGMFAVFVLTWIALGPILGMPFALLFAAIAGVLEIVPTVGPILSAVPPAVVALGISPTLFLWVVVAFIIIQQIENHLLVPMILGSAVQIHPVSVLFSLTVLGGLFGIVGIFLSVPAAVTVKLLVYELHVKQMEKQTGDVQEKADSIVSGE